MSNDYKQLALAAVMFFAPMAKSLLQQNKNITEKERNFVESYIQYGYMTIIVGAITITLVIAYYFFPSGFLYRLHTLSIIATIALLVIGSIGVIAGTTIYKKNQQSNDIIKDNTQVILYFLPIYNIYQRYKEHNFDNPNKRIKESIVWRTVIIILTIVLQKETITGFFGLLLMIRAATIAGGIDIVSQKGKQYMTQAFHTNPEEMRSYVIASIEYINQKIQNKIIQVSWEELLIGYKKSYSYLSPINKNILIQYAIGIAIIIVTSIIHPAKTIIMRRTPIALIIGRYLIMYIKRKHLPPLPIAREIQLTAQNIYDRIKQ